MHTPVPTYRPLVPPRDIPRRHAGYDGYSRPHTYGVRYCPCDPNATNPCRPTACTERAMPAPSPSTANYKLLTPNSSYSFSAKERDSETGLSYFGSRYYSSDLSIWLSVDPMAAKFPYQSNFVYCGNNPINVMDPNGEDEYEFDECGNLVNTICNDEIDKFHILDSEGNRKCSSGDFAVNTFSITKDDLFGTMMEVTNGENHEEIALDAFEFFAYHTEVEWECITTDRTSYVGTSKMNHSTNIYREVLDKGVSLRFHRHNHPGGDPYPSGKYLEVDGKYQLTGDKKMARDLKKLYPDAIFEVYTKGGHYQQYNGEGVVYDNTITINL